MTRHRADEAPVRSGRTDDATAPRAGAATGVLRRSRTRLLLLAGATCLLATVLAGATVIRPVPMPGLTVGVTHTERSADRWNASPAVDRALGVLADVAPMQNQHLMGWGAGNPEPSPGQFDFASLDRRIRLISATGATPVLTLCCAPDWMKGGVAGSTDWDRIEEAPDPGHFQDFADLAARAAERYPEVRHFVVWNELKGFYDRSRNEWDAAAYTDLYNRVYRAVKGVRPDALVGGPYVVFDSWASDDAGGHPSTVRGVWGVLDQRPLDVVDYWLTHAAGADFIAVDAPTRTRDKGLTTTDFEATGKLAAITEWVRERTELPIWWVEISADCSACAATSGSARRAVVMLDALVAVARAGASTAFLWGAQGSENGETAALFSDTADATGGEPLPLARLLAPLREQLQQDPSKVVTSWQPTTSTWKLSTPDWSVSWSPDTGLEGPVPRPAEAGS